MIMFLPLAIFKLIKLSHSLDLEPGDLLRKFRLVMLATCFAGPGEIDFFAIVSTKLSRFSVNDIPFHLPLGEFAASKASYTL